MTQEQKNETVELAGRVCEVCNKPATHRVVDMIQRKTMGTPIRRQQPHYFCDEHTRPSQIKR